MENVRACVMCLEMDGTLYNLRSNSLERYYRILTGTDPLTSLELPMFACYVCKAMLYKFYSFRQRSLRVQAILQGILQSNGKVLEQDIRRLDKKSYHLNSNLSIQNVVEIKIINEEDNEDTIKEEPLEELDCEFSFQTNADNDWLSDDEPLSIHKSEKMKVNLEEMEVNIEEEIKEREDNVDEKPPKASKTRKPKKALQPKVVCPRKDILKTVMNQAQGALDDIKLETHITVINLTEEEQLEEIRKRRESLNYKNSAFKCELCFKGFIDTQAWQHHMQRHDKSSGSLECNICKMRFKTTRLLKKHHAIHAKKFICKYCPYVSKHVTPARQHLFWHQGVKYKCPYCEEILSNGTSYRSHVRIKHPSDYICGFCGYSFVSQLGLNMHRTLMHKGLKCSEEIANGRAYWAHFRKYHPDKEYPVEKRHICDVCGKGFMTNALLMFHKRTHSAVKAFKCGECGKAFHNRVNLLTHGRVHSERRPHVCCACGKAFKCKAALDRHLLSHTGDKPYKCEVCGKAFAQSYSCKVHVRTVHLKQPSTSAERSRRKRK
ncbi:zinc finger protein 184-like isoform X2 [Colias croceus]|uniref:zinc finger protein 184-like isoform X2 n=1 Tax=Colias crocea TaxID=72248 RepID=UPI001E280AA7|nr:zinc finger protein 184-like isoform X2 [Colias croceus]